MARARRGAAACAPDALRFARRGGAGRERGKRRDRHRRARRALLRGGARGGRRQRLRRAGRSTSAALEKSGRKVLLASWSEGARDRLGQVLADHGLLNLKPVDDFAALKALPDGVAGLAVLPLETGFEAPDLAVIGDQDVLGDRFVRTDAPQARRRRADRGVEPRRRRSRRPRRPRHRPLHRAQDHRGGGRAARLPGDPLRRRRPAVPAGGEHRASDPLRRGGLGGRSRPARRRRLAEPQGAAEEAHPRHGGAADQDRRRAADAAGAGACRRPPASTTSSPRASPTRRRRTRTPRSRRRSTTFPPGGRWTGSSAATSASARPRWRSAPPSSRRWTGKQVAVVVPTTLLARQHFAHLHRALPRPAAQYRAGLAARRLGRARARQEGHRRRHDRHRDRHARAARQGDRVQGPRRC